MGGHRIVSISRPFLLGRYPVTQDLYKAVTGGNPSRFKGPFHDPGRASRPVENVSWYDAVRFCNQLSGMEGLRPCYIFGDRTENEDGDETTEVSCDWKADGYRLPTEAEWEYAAKAGTELEYAGSDNLDDVGWYDGNSGEKTHPGGLKKANAWGLYDMSGNVWEWCWEKERTARVSRGGSWSFSAKCARVANRGGRYPGYGYDDCGFRLSRSAP